MLNKKLVAVELRKIAKKLEGPITIDFSMPKSYRNLKEYSGRIIVKSGSHESSQIEVTNFSFDKVVSGYQIFKGDDLKVVSGTFSSPLFETSDGGDMRIGFSSFQRISGSFLKCLFFECGNLNMDECLESEIQWCNNVSIKTVKNTDITKSNNISISKLFDPDTELYFIECSDIECKFEISEKNSTNVHFVKCGGVLNVPKKFDAKFKDCNFQKDSTHFSFYSEFLDLELAKSRKISIDPNDPNLDRAIFIRKDWYQIKDKYIQAYVNLWSSNKEEFGFKEDEIITPSLVMDRQWNREHSFNGFTPYSEHIDYSDKYILVLEDNGINVYSFSTSNDLAEIIPDWSNKKNWR